MIDSTFLFDGGGETEPSLKSALRFADERGKLIIENNLDSRDHWIFDLFLI